MRSSQQSTLVPWIPKLLVDPVALWVQSCQGVHTSVVLQKENSAPVLASSVGHCCYLLPWWPFLTLLLFVWSFQRLTGALCTCILLPLPGELYRTCAGPTGVALPLHDLWRQLSTLPLLVHKTLFTCPEPNEGFGSHGPWRVMVNSCHHEPIPGLPEWPPSGYLMPLASTAVCHTFPSL